MFDYQYDLVGRLIAVRKNGSPFLSYKYDQNGNRVEANEKGSSIKGSYDAQDRLLSYGTNKYTYTLEGDLSSKTQNGQQLKYQYDVLGNLIKVTFPNGTILEYIIDAAGRRIGKKIDGKFVKGWIYKDGINPIAELDKNGKVLTRFVYATRANIPTYLIKNGRTYQIISDHLGSPRLIVDTDTGTIAQRIEYDVWGRVQQDSQPGFQPFGFAGGLYERDTEFLRLGARDYDTQVGRWTSKDPSGLAGGMNLYSYTANDPVNLIDINGRDWRRWGWVAKLGKYSEGIASFSAGVGDVMLAIPGAGWLARRVTGSGSLVNPCSGSYIVGSVAGAALSGSLVARYIAGRALTSAVVIENAAQNATNGVKLQMQLASMQQMGEAGVAMAGAGTNTPIKVVNRLVERYGGKVADWVKKTSNTVYTAPSGIKKAGVRKFQTHWYENVKTGLRVEFKSKIDL